MEKICFKCNLLKPLNDFYKHPEMPDGHVNKCKNCNKKDVQENYNKKAIDPAYIEKERTRGRKKYHKLYAGKVKSKKNTTPNINWVQKFPEKRSASLKSASIKKLFDGAEKHHWSYNKEHYKDVIQLSKKDHCKSHRFLVYDQERFMYRRYDTNELLDTKEKHEQFIRWCIYSKED